jgi:hypothetical protein
MIIAAFNGIPSFDRAEVRSKELLGHSECALCGRIKDPNAIVAVTDTTRERGERRIYYPYFHFVCTDCHDTLVNHPVDDDYDTSDIPEWSYMHDYLLFSDIRPMGIARIFDTNAVRAMLDEVCDQCCSWDEFVGLTYDYDYPEDNAGDRGEDDPYGHPGDWMYEDNADRENWANDPYDPPLTPHGLDDPIR